jgi:hypothetical protein
MDYVLNMEMVIKRKAANRDQGIKGIMGFEENYWNELRFRQ